MKINIDLILKYKLFSKNRNIKSIKENYSVIELNKLLHQSKKNKQLLGDFWIDLNLDNEQNNENFNSDSEEKIHIKILKKKIPTKKNKKTVLVSSLLKPFKNTKNLINVEDDGNCGYHAFIRAMKEKNYSLIINNKIRDTPDLLREFIKRSLSKSKNKSDIDTKIRASGGIKLKGFIPEQFWMEDNELSVLSNAFDVCIHVWDERIESDDENIKWSFFPSNIKYSKEFCLNKKNNIFLYLNNNHYQVISKI